MVGLEQYKHIPIPETEIVPFVVPHVPQCVMVGRIRKQVEDKARSHNRDKAMNFPIRTP